MNVLLSIRFSICLLLIESIVTTFAITSELHGQMTGVARSMPQAGKQGIREVKDVTASSLEVENNETNSRGFPEG
jgi:hypothetical protein